MKLTDALAALDREQLMENHRSTTRDTYRGWVRDYSRILKAGTVDGFQGYLDHLATVRRVSWKTRKQALNALIFFHRRVLKLEIPSNSLKIGIPTKGKRVPVFLTHAVGYKGTPSPLDKLGTFTGGSIVDFPQQRRA